MCVCAYMQAYAWDVLGVHACMYSVPWPNDVHMCVSTVCKCRCVWMHVHVPECLWRTWVYILPKELTHIGTRRLIHTYMHRRHAHLHTHYYTVSWLGSSHELSRESLLYKETQMSNHEH